MNGELMTLTTLWFYVKEADKLIVSAIKPSILLEHIDVISSEWNSCKCFSETIDERDELKDKIENLKRELQDENTRHNNEKIEWTRTERQKNARIAELEADLRNSETQKTELRQRAENAERVNEDKDSQIREWRRRYDEVNEIKERLDSELSAERLRNASDRLNWQNTESELRRQDAIKEERLNNANTEIASLRRENVDFRTELTQKNDEIGKLEGELAEKNSQLSEKEKELNQKRLLIKDLTSESKILELFAIELNLNKENQTQSTNTNQEKDWKNINSNFTPELTQEWIKHGFTYEQCQEWINIVSPQQQNQAIKESAYYTWLRDVKKVDAEWVLNHGQVEQLGQEFFRWYQEQYQTQQEIPTNQ